MAAQSADEICSHCRQRMASRYRRALSVAKAQCKPFGAMATPYKQVQFPTSSLMGIRTNMPCPLLFPLPLSWTIALFTKTCVRSISAECQRSLIPGVQDANRPAVPSFATGPRDVDCSILPR
jgi:hypothetical protein